MSSRTDLPAALRQALLASGAGGAGALSLADTLAGPEPRLTATLIALDARLCIAGAMVPLHDRLTVDGRIVPRPEETVEAFVVPAQRRASCYHEEPDLALGLAAVGGLTGAGASARVTDLRAVWWGVAPTPLIAHQLTGALQGRSPTPSLIDLAAQTARGEVQPAGAGAELDAARLDAVERICRDALGALFAAAPPRAAEAYPRLLMARAAHGRRHDADRALGDLRPPPWGRRHVGALGRRAGRRGARGRLRLVLPRRPPRDAPALPAERPHAGALPAGTGRAAGHPALPAAALAPGPARGAVGHAGRHRGRPARLHPRRRRRRGAVRALRRAVVGAPRPHGGGGAPAAPPADGGARHARGPLLATIGRHGQPTPGSAAAILDRGKRASGRATRRARRRRLAGRAGRDPAPDSATSSPGTARRRTARIAWPRSRRSPSAATSTSARATPKRKPPRPPSSSAATAASTPRC